MLITSFYCVAGKQYFYAKIYSQKRATLAMQQDNGTARQQDYGTTGPRDYETTRLRDCETTGRRDNETTRLRDYGTTGLRDYGTTGQQKNTGVLRRSQAFSVFLSRARQLGVRVVQQCRR